MAGKKGSGNDCILRNKTKKLNKTSFGIHVSSIISNKKVCIGVIQWIFTVLFGLLIGNDGYCREQPLLIDSNTGYPIIPTNAVRIYSFPENLSSKRFFREHEHNNLEKRESKFAFGYSNDWYWVLLDVQNQITTSFDMVLEVNNPFIDQVYFFRMEDEKFAELLGKGGDRIKFNERTELNRRYIFRDKIQAGKTKKYLLKVDKRNASVSFPIRIWDEASFADFDLKQNIVNGGIITTLGFIAFLSILSGYLLKDRLFLSYGFYVLFLAALIFASLGYGFQFIYPESTTLNQYCRPVLGFFMFFLMLNFFREFVNLNQHYPMVNKVIKWGLAFLGGLMALWFLLNGLFYEFAQSLVIPGLIILFSADLLFITGVFVLIYFLWKKASPRPQIFLASLGMQAIAIVLLIFEEFGWITIKAHFWVHPMVAGSFMEVMVLSTAMLSILARLVKSKKALLLENERMNEKVKKQQLQVFKLKNNELIKVHDIQYLRSSGQYVEFHIIHEPYPLLDRTSMKEVQDQLNEHQFVRIHRSFIVNLAYVNTVYHNHLILESGTELKVSRTYKDLLREKLNTYYSLESVKST